MTFLQHIEEPARTAYFKDRVRLRVKSLNDFKDVVRAAENDER